MRRAGTHVIRDIGRAGYLFDFMDAVRGPLLLLLLLFLVRRNKNYCRDSIK